MFYKTIDLFAGIGGISIGFERVGRFKTVYANDFERACKSTYDLNSKGVKLDVRDIASVKTRDIPDFDFLLAGFPCQPFSVAGHRKGFDDELGRGNLFFEISRILKEKEKSPNPPKGFFLENVKNLENHNNGDTFQRISSELRSLGYEFKSQVLNSLEYGGVPQNRERIYIVGFKDHHSAVRFNFPGKIKARKKITDLLEKKVDNKYYYNGKALYKRLRNQIVNKNTVYQWRRQYVRENKRGVCPTLTANMGMGGHNVPIILDNKGIRKLTPRECARVQGFPETYKLPFNLADSALYKQFGNSVTVTVVQRIARQILLAVK
jgi:DNA (cytosine-5)-methyltransferase 1